MNENSWPKVHTFRVAIRVRPFLKHEISNIPAIRFLPNDAQMLVADDRPFVFDHIYNEESQENFYESLIYPMVTKLLEGYHCTIMAYGHTGTGKTHTMGSGINAEAGLNAGLLHRSLDDIFLRAAQKSAHFSISISGIEIYNDKAYDLLGDAERPLKVARMCSASSHLVRNRDEAVAHFRKGILARHTRSTKLNHQSSRSHALFTVHCNIKNGDHETNACLHLVDLAGTEGVRETGHEGAAFTEGIKINQSLLGLHLLLRNLAKSDNNVSYRESLLTTLLQDALNSNNYVTLIGCISPSMEDIKSTLTTLDFVSGAKSVRSKPLLQLQYKEYKENHCDGDHVKEEVVFRIPRTPQTKLRIPFSAINTPLNEAKRIYGKKTGASKSYTESPRNLATPRKAFSPKKNNTFTIPHKPNMKSYKINGRMDHAAKVKSISSTPITGFPSMYQKPAKSFEYSGFISDMSRISTSSSVALSETKSYSPVINKIRGEVEGILSRLEGIEKERRENEKWEKERRDVTLKAMKNVSELENYTYDNSTLKNTMSENCRDENKRLRRSMRISQRRNISEQSNTINDSTQRPPGENNTLVSQTMKENVQQNVTKYNPLKVNNGHFTINLTMDKLGNPVILDAYGMPNVTRSKSKENAKKTKQSPPRSTSYYRIRKLVLHILNTSTVKDLQILETVGPITAQLIFEHRERIGKFKSLRELKNVPFWKHKAYQRFLTANNL